MKKIIGSLLIFVMILTGCGNKATIDSDMIGEGKAFVNLKGDVKFDVTGMYTTTRYGGYETDNEYARILVMDVTFTNNSSEQFYTGSSLIKGTSNDMDLQTPLIATEDAYIGINLYVEPGESVSKQIAYGINISPSADKEILLTFNDLLFTEILGELTVNIDNVEEKLPEKPKEAVATGGFEQSKSYGGATVEIGKVKAISAEELQKSYPDMMGLQNGFVYLLVDTSITNNSEHTLERFKAELKDDMDNTNYASSTQTRYIDNGYAPFDDVIAPGETSGGTMLFTVDDRVTGGQLSFNVFSKVEELKLEKITFDVKIVK